MDAIPASRSIVFMRGALGGFALAGSACAVLGAVLLFAACGDNGPVTYATPFDAAILDDHYVPPEGVGDPCSPQSACRTGLTCTGSTCAPGYSSPPGTACVISDECTTGNYCGPSRTCAPAGTGASGATCGSDADCGPGLRCDIQGLSAVCALEGTTDVGGTCTTSADCFGGLDCASGTCTAPPPSTGATPPLGISTWTGATCSDDPGPTAAYFRVPRGQDDGDFFRLPFPNDIRTSGGHPDYSLFPTPGSGILGYDLVARYASYIDANLDGFSAYPTITLRFSGAVDFASLSQSGALQLLEISTAGATPVGFEWTMTTGRNQYVCNNALSARPQQGQPLKPGTQYMFVVSTAVQASNTDGGTPPVAVPSDLQALLASTAPSDPALATAYTTYAPLRDWASANGGASNVLDAALFTTGTPTALPQSAIAAVQAAAAPTATSWTLCNGTNVSPCPQATGDRACGTPDPAFYELHALVTLPIVQSGTEPYLDPTQGGDLATDGNGNVQVTRTEQVCMGLTVPKTTMPSDGWPLVIFAHGTGGSFRSHVPEGVAANLAAATSSAGTVVPMAVLGIDQVETGTRRGTSTESPDDLFYNFANPGASRGNPVQGAADQASLLLFAQTATVAASVTGSAIKFGTTVAFWGHSQGATEGGIAMPYVKGYAGAVLSGEGASLVDALLTKQNPVDVAAVVPTVLEDPAIGVYHPALALFQNALDLADPLNHASAIAASPLSSIGPKHLFQPYGIGDTYAPPVTEQTFAIAAGLGVASPPSSVTSPDAIGGITPTPVPASANLGTSKNITGFVREYVSQGSYDPHFVAFDQIDAEQDVARFLADVESGAIPKVGP
jgi:hypothetical protein